MSDDNCEADDESDAKLDNAIKDIESSVRWDVNAPRNVPRSIRPTEWSNRRFKTGLWWSIPWKQGGIRETKKVAQNGSICFHRVLYVA